MSMKNLKEKYRHYAENELKNAINNKMSFDDYFCLKFITNSNNEEFYNQIIEYISVNISNGNYKLSVIEKENEDNCVYDILENNKSIAHLWVVNGIRYIPSNQFGFNL